LIPLWTALITATVSISSTLVAVFYGPSWKDRVDAARARRLRSEQLLMRYSEPLARAAYELQSRLFNISHGRLMTESRTTLDYRRQSTLWLFGQFLAWVEIVRREVQVIDFGDLRRTAELQRHMFDVADILSSGGLDDPQFRLLRAEQRAVGELMVVDRGVGDQQRSDSMGYAEFNRNLEEDPAFTRWFAPLNETVDSLFQGNSVGFRAVLIQRRLIDLIDFFDPDYIRFPDRNERGRLPLPAGRVDRKRLRPPTQIARFRSASDPIATAEAWAQERRLQIAKRGPEMRIGLARRHHFGQAHDIVVLHRHGYTEVYVLSRGEEPSDRATGQSATEVKLRNSEIDLVNTLLKELDRPALPRQRRSRVFG
jgi:hypothetical protein